MDVPEEVTELHRQLKSNKEKLQIKDIGAGSRVSTSDSRTIASLVKKSSVSTKYGKLLFRLTKWYQPASILEFGTGVGISTMYFKAGSPSTPITTVEGSIEKHQFAKALFEGLGNDEIKLVREDFNVIVNELIDTLPDHVLLFIDGDHRYKPTINKVKDILEKDTISECLLILDDIYWSKDMERAWKECREDKRVDISIDLFYFGLLIKRPGISKQHLRINF